MIITYRPHSVLRLLCVGCVCLMAASLIGCGKKEEASTPGYYNGPLQKKGTSAPAGGTTAPPTRGKASID